MGARACARTECLADLNQLRHVGQEGSGLLVQGAETAVEHLELEHPWKLKQPTHLRQVQRVGAPRLLDDELAATEVQEAARLDNAAEQGVVPDSVSVVGRSPRLLLSPPPRHLCRSPRNAVRPARRGEPAEDASPLQPGPHLAVLHEVLLGAVEVEWRGRPKARPSPGSGENRRAREDLSQLFSEHDHCQGQLLLVDLQLYFGHAARVHRHAEDGRQAAVALDLANLRILEELRQGQPVLLGRIVDAHFMHRLQARRGAHLRHRFQCRKK